MTKHTFPATPVVATSAPDTKDDDKNSVASAFFTEADIASSDGMVHATDKDNLPTALAAEAAADGTPSKPAVPTKQ